MTATTTAINTCALWGTTSYVNSWLTINIAVILVSLLAIAAAYSLSGFFPASTRSKVRGFVRFEMIQMIISIVIIAALLAFSAAACSISTTVSQSLSGTTLNPFQYADYYVGAVSLGTGLTLLTNIYSTTVSYAVYASVVRNTFAAFTRFGTSKNWNTPFFNWAIIQQLLGKTNGLPFTGGLCNGRNFCDYERIPSLNIASIYTLFAEQYLFVYSPIILIAVGLLFIQFLALPVMQYTAFTIILPVAIAMRSLSFFGSSLGDASNAMIAIAIAFYIIYPMTVAFDAYAIHYVFSASNPAAQYADTAFTVNAVTPFSYLQQNPTNGAILLGNSVSSLLGCVGGAVSSTSTLCSSAFSTTPWSFFVPAWGLMDSLHYYTNNMAQFIFQAIVLFALNISITVGLALSIYRGLKSELGESGRFW